MFVCLFPLPTCTNKTIKEWWYGTVGAWIFDLSSQTPFQLTNSLLKKCPTSHGRSTSESSSNQRRKHRLPKKGTAETQNPQPNSPLKGGRFNSFISSQWVSSTNHRPKNCAGSHRAAREGGSHSSQTRCILVLVSQLGWDPVRGRDIIYIYICVCTNVSIYIYTYISTDIYILYIYIHVYIFFI